MLSLCISNSTKLVANSQTRFLLAIAAFQTSIAKVETVRRFPTDIRGTLLKIMQLNYHTCTLLLNVQQKLTMNPSNASNTNIRFTNALNRLSVGWLSFLGGMGSLLEACASQGPNFLYRLDFEGLLKADFKYLPGEEKVAKGQFQICDTQTGAVVAADA